MKYNNTTRVLLTHGDSTRKNVTDRSPESDQRSQPEDCRDEQAPGPALLLALPEAGIAAFVKYAT